MTKASQSKSVNGNSGKRTMCRVESCDRTAFFNGQCYIHGLQEYYGSAKADIEVAHAVVGSKSRSKIKG